MLALICILAYILAGMVARAITLAIEPSDTEFGAICFLVWPLVLCAGILLVLWLALSGISDLIKYCIVKLFTKQVKKEIIR